jgi:SAM-dependent methyltransferase
LKPEAQSWGAEIFDRIYARQKDPWGFRESPYEQEKYAATLDLLPARRFGHGLELGCSIGVFTAALAGRCDRLLAVDCAAAALVEARSGCAQRRLPGEFPDGSFDLIVISELLYFLSESDVARMAGCARRAIVAGGLVVLANWTGPTDTPCTGEAAAALFVQAAAPAIRPLSTLRRSTYRLDLLSG